MINHPTTVQNMRTIVDRYDVFVFPIYGVMHDGQKLSEDVFHILKNLRHKNKTVSILTNVCRRRRAVINLLASYGVCPSLYQHVITAGEEVHHYLKSRHSTQASNLGRRCYIIGPSESLEVLEGVPINRVRNIEDADFILALGVDEWHSDVNHYQSILKSGLKKNLRMVCANPDYYVVVNGERHVRAGAIAHSYETLGGIVYYIGKPKMSFYNALAQDLNPFRQEDTLIIGDSIKVDVLGAFTSGYDSLLLINDTTLDDLCLSRGADDDVSYKTVVQHLQARDVIPTYMTKRLVW